MHCCALGTYRLPPGLGWGGAPALGEPEDRWDGECDACAACPGGLVRVGCANSSHGECLGCPIGTCACHGTLRSPKPAALALRERRHPRRVAQIRTTRTAGTHRAQHARPAPRASSVVTAAPRTRATAFLARRGRTSLGDRAMARTTARGTRCVCFASRAQRGRIASAVAVRAAASACRARRARIDCARRRTATSPTRQVGTATLRAAGRRARTYGTQSASPACRAPRAPS